MAYTVRRFENADTEAVVALWTECGLVRPWNDPRRDIARKLSVQPELFLVVVDDAEPASVVVGAGMAGFDGHRGWVNYLAVDPGHRRQGIARLLMSAFEESLTAMGCPKLNLQIRAGNESVIAFYERLGYAPDQAVSLGKRLIPDA